MDHQLSSIKQKHILEALKKIDVEGVPTNNQWNQYWINYNKKLYPFKYTVSVANTIVQGIGSVLSFSSNESSRNYISSLGFHITYKSTDEVERKLNYWVGATYFGPMTNQKDKFKHFIKKKNWATDHDLSTKEGKAIFEDLKKVQINDRICLRYFDKKGGTIEIIAIGTVENTAEIKKGKISVIWDNNPTLYKGNKPSGKGAGNWWRTFFELKREVDIELIFSEIVIERRIARLAWNSKGWVEPSGRLGKSQDKNSHEAVFGYGHEEWLFDAGKLIDGYHYGFLEPVRQQHQAYEGKYFNVWLYSIDGETQKRYWVGEINKLYVIDDAEAEIIKQRYKENGWLDEMIMQLKGACGAGAKFSGWKSLGLFNIKFKPEDVYLNDSYLELEKNHPVYAQSRYIFTLYKEEFKVDLLNTGFIFTPSKRKNNAVNSPVSQTYNREPKVVELTFLHRTISDSLTQYLAKEYGSKNVVSEHSSGVGASRIDIVVNDKGKIIFYEIKTYPTLRTSIREALGQLLEYCFYPNQQNADELIIVSQIPVTEEIKGYFALLRKTFKFPVFYQSYHWQTKILSEKF